MNIVAAAISGVAGAIFFAAGYTYYIQPDFIKSDILIDTLFTTQQSKARAAVTRLLINPSSARFDGLRSVQDDGAKFVCGNVNAKDRSGNFAGYRAFVYTASIDFARIDDDGTIAQRHDTYRECPVPIEAGKIAQQDLAISPGALQALKTIQGALPATSETSALSQLSDQAKRGGVGGGGAAGGNMQTQLQQLGRTPEGVAAGQQQASSRPSSGTSSNDGIGGEADWRADAPPARWPAFPPGHPLAKPAPQRGHAAALALARDVEDRWQRGAAEGSMALRPSREEILEAERALLAIDPKSGDFPQAWAAFVRLRALEREAVRS